MKRCRGPIGWATANFLFWVTTLHVVSRPESHGVHGRKGVRTRQGSCACSSTHDSTSTCLRPGVERTTDGFCRDRGLSAVTGDGGFHVSTWFIVSRHGLAVVGGWVAT